MDREWCHMFIAAFYKSKLLRGVTANLQHAFRIFLRSLETVFLVADEDTSRALLHSAAAAVSSAPSPLLPTTALSNDDDDNPAPHPFLILGDRFSETPDPGDTASATTVTSFVSASWTDVHRL
jgi:hypothetical protein